MNIARYCDNNNIKHERNQSALIYYFHCKYLNHYLLLLHTATIATAATTAIDDASIDYAIIVGAIATAILVCYSKAYSHHYGLP